MKMLLIALAGVQALIFQVAARRNPPGRIGETPRVQERIAGFVSLVLWIGVVAAGRWIGFI
jgi:hypothetical protein